MTLGKLTVGVTEAGDTATIYLNGSFVFQAHRDFKASYEHKLKQEHIAHLVIDFANVEYLDSSALGMLLVLKDKVETAKKTITLVRPNTVTAQTFDIAGFYKQFTIKE